MIFKFFRFSARTGREEGNLGGIRRGYKVHSTETPVSRSYEISFFNVLNLSNSYTNARRYPANAHNNKFYFETFIEQLYKNSQPHNNFSSQILISILIFFFKQICISTNFYI